MKRLGTWSSIAALGAAASGALAGCAPADTTGDADTAQAQQPIGQPLAPESEPNGAFAQATPIGNDVVVRASLYPDGDVDVYSFQATAGSRVFAAIMNSFSVQDTSDTSDTLMDILDTDGATVIESDDDNGSLGSLSSTVSGTPIAATGTYFVRVQHYSTTSQNRPYDLHFRVQSGAPAAEVELNDTTAQAQALPASGFIGGALSSAADIDVYAINVQAGDTIFASLDNDPTSDGTEFNGALAIGPIGGVNLQVNDGGGTGPDSEAIFVTPQAAGTYYVAVTGAAAGDYTLSVSVHQSTSAVGCATYTSADVPKTIPAAGGQVTSTITVPGSPRMGDVNVRVQLNHTAMTDVDAHVLTPAGNTNGLFTDIGSATYPSLDAMIDDEGPYPVSSFPAITGHTVNPEPDYRMRWLYGENGGGQWTLVLNDDTNNVNGGTLTGWSLTICDQPVPAVACAGGAPPVTALAADFESGAQGFTHSGAADTWARGTPSAAPITSCNGGSNCWKTNLAGTYSASANQNLISPAIDLSQQKAPIQLKWAMKYQMETAYYDHAWVEIHEVGGANPRRLWEFLDATMVTQVGAASTTLQESAGWGTQFADVSAYAGKQVELVFHVDSDSTAQYAGLAIDDVSVIGCPTQVCGNGALEAPETCDDGNLVSGDGCDASCKPTGCGSGVVTMGEVCDDGNQVNGDGCDSNCTATGCGNGIATMGEACDDGNQVDGDGCDTNCTASACGNGVKAPNEACDDGNVVSGDGCDANCTATACGNGIVTAGEMCDDGNGVLGDGCDDGPTGNCTPSQCGNGVLAGGEGCDDGNLVNGDGCDADCTVTGCGNGVVTMGEDCDDGNAVSGDGCDNNCTATGCGNGVQTDGEACDDGNLVEGDGCDTNCTASACGNGITGDPETCDDGNQTDGDGCDSNCTQTGCGNGVATEGEACDDGNTAEGDGCDNNCTATACGNGVVTEPEECDDGNAASGDGCSSTCKTEGSTGGTGGVGAGGSGAGGSGASGSGATGGGGSGGSSEQPGGCGCTIPGDDRPSSPWAAVLAMAALGVTRIRRRRSAN